MKFHLAILSLVLFVASATAQDEGLDGAVRQAFNFVGQCGEKELLVCLKERALKFIDTSSGSVELSDGVTLKQSETVPEEPKDVQLPEEPRARESMIDNLLTDKVANFLSSHTLEFKIPKETVSEMKRSLEEARRKKKKMLLPLLLLLKLKAAMLIPLAMKAIALIAFKALVIGKIALVITLVIAFKKLLEGKHGAQTYEVVAHPHASHSHISSFGDEHHGHYSRSIDEDPQKLAYNAYAPAQ